MSVARCPQCSDEVRLPHGASSRATVQCPLCQAQFTLSEVIDRLPPALIVLDDPAALELETVELPKMDPSVTRSMDISAATSVPATPSFRVSDGGGVGATKARPAARVRSGPAARKKKASPAMEIVKVVGGGAVGLAAAQLILWWIPSGWVFGLIKSNAQRDPIGLAKAVNNFAPWILPEGLQNKKSTDNGQTEVETPEPVQLGNNSGSGGRNSSASRNTAAPSKLSQSGLPEMSFDDPNQPAAKPAGKPSGQNKPVAKAKPTDNSGLTVLDEPAFEPAAPATPEIKLDLLDEPAKPANPKPAVKPEETPAEAPAEKPEEKPQPKPAAAKVAEAPLRTAAEVKAALDDAQTALDAWTSAAEVKPDLLRQSYGSFIRLAEAAAYADREDPAAGHAAEIAALAAALAQDDAKLRFLALAGGKWFKATSRDSSGLLIVGEVKEVTPRGDLHEISLTLTEGEPSIAVLCSQTPAATIAAGTRLIVLGAIVAEPKTKIAGYDGEADTAIWCGALHALPAAEPAE